MNLNKAPGQVPYYMAAARNAQTPNMSPAFMHAARNYDILGGSQRTATSSYRNDERKRTC